MKKILIVDDEPDTLEVLGKRLEQSGYEVLKASSGPDALNVAKSEKPNLIILDIFMPEMDGGAVAQSLRADPETQSIPIIFLSCLFTKSEEAQEGHQVGENFYVAKPYNPAEFIDIIREKIH
jgi:CheY-like chemotaxis protein